MKNIISRREEVMDRDMWAREPGMYFGNDKPCDGTSERARGNRASAWLNKGVRDHVSKGSVLFVERKATSVVCILKATSPDSSATVCPADLGRLEIFPSPLNHSAGCQCTNDSM